MRPLFLALVLCLVASTAAQAQTESPALSYQSGFATLHDHLGDQMGTPLTAEFPNPDNGDTLQWTTSGILFWSDSHWPTWTNGWLHAAISPVGQLVQWEGEALDPPAISVPAVVLATPASFGWPIGGSLGQRIYCVEAIESGHGRAMYNPTPIWDGEHAQGWLGFIPSTARRWGANIGDRVTEWLAAARMIAAGAGSQFFGIASGRC